MNRGIRLNFIPPALQAAQARRQRLMMWSTLIGVTLLLDASVAALHWIRHGTVEATLREAAKLEAETEALKQRLIAAIAEAKDVSGQIERGKALRVKRSWSALLTTVGRTMPPECWLTSFATDPDVPPPAPQRAAPSSPGAQGSGSEKGKSGVGPKPVVVTLEAPRRLILRGQSRQATDPLTFVTQLRKQNAFKNVSLERTARGPAADDPFQFEIRCEW